MFDVRKNMGPNDLHLVCSAKYGKASLFDNTGKKKYTVACLCEGQHDNWRLPRGDTPPGAYKAGVVYTQTSANLSQLYSYGRKCVDLVDLDNQETGNDRSGVSLHGGGTGLPNPVARLQELIPTWGCIRVHNADLEEKIVPDVERCQKRGGTFFVSVVDRD